MMISLILMLLQMTASFVDAQKDQGTWDGNEEICCGCVPFYACDEDEMIDFLRYSKIDNHHEESDKQNFSAAINVKECESKVDFCCLLPNVTQDCYYFKPTIPKINKEPQPSVQCECKHWEMCPLDSMVTDGKGAKSSKMEDYGLITHSQCKQELQVCCSDDKPTVLPRSGLIIQYNQECTCLPLEQCLLDGSLNKGGKIMQPRTEAISTRLGNRNHCPKNEVCCFTYKKTGSGTGNMRKFNSIFIVYMIAFSLNLYIYI